MDKKVRLYVGKFYAWTNPAWVAYVLVAGITLAVLLLRIAMSAYFDIHLTLILFMLPIIASAFIGGLWGGLLSTLLSALGSMYFIIMPVGSFGMSNSHDFIQWLIMILSGVVVSALTGEFYKARNKLELEIIEHEQMGAALQQSEERYRGLIENMNDLIVEVDEEGNYCYISPNYETLSGYSVVDEVGTSIFTHVHPDDVGIVRESFKTTLREEKRNITYRVQGQDGDWYWVETSGKPYKTADGERHVISVVRDISARKQVEDALLESEARFHSLFEHAPVGVLLADMRGNILEVNPAALEILGSPSAEATRQINIINFPPLVKAGISADFQRCVATSQFLTTERSYISKWGKSIELNLRFTPLIKIRGTSMLLVLLEDFTERKLALDQLQKSENRNRVLVNAIPDMIFRVSKDGIFLDYKGNKDDLYFPPEVFLGKSVYDVLPLEVAEQCMISISRAPKGGIQAFEYQLEMKDSMRSYEARMEIDAASEESIFIIRDITDRKQSEKNLHEQLQELETLYETGLTLAHILTPEQIGQKFIELLEQKMNWHHTIIRLYDKETEHLHVLAFNMDESSISRERFDRVSTIRDGVTGWAIQHNQVVRSGDLEQDERYKETFPNMRSGMYVPMRSRQRLIGAISIESDKPDAFSASDERLVVTLANQAAVALENANLYQTAQQEIDERIRVEELLAEERNQLALRVEERTADLTHSNADLARAVRVKDEFLASMSHELRTPLTGILGLSEALQLNVYGSLTDRQKSILANIETSGRHLLELINDILDVSKIEAGKLELQMDVCVLSDICQSSIQLTRGLANKKNQKINFSMHPDTILVNGDPRRLKQVLVNLLSNAVKFTPEGGSIGLDVTANEKENITYIAVKDTGIGISAEDMPKLFQPFVQLDTKLSRHHNGTGLGLSLVHQLVELHGGSIEVQSTLNEGSCFTVALPCLPADEQVDAMHGSLRTKFRKVLIVEDNPVDAERLNRYLQSLGIIPMSHIGSGKILERIMDVKPDLILLDQYLPGVSGWEVLDQLKSNPDAEQIPVVLTSITGDESQTLKQTADGYLPKLFTLEDLRSILENLQKTRKVKKTVPETRGDIIATVMIVDDNEVNVEVLTDYLIAKKFRVESAYSGADFLARVTKIQPDIVMMDIQMPGMDGLEVIRRLRTFFFFCLASMPIIATTALAMPGDRERCFEAGANEYVSKPFHLKDVNELLQRIIKEK